jgi:hypothetical protein
MLKVNFKHLLFLGIISFIIYNFDFEFIYYHNKFTSFSLKVTLEKCWNDPLFDNFPLLERLKNKDFVINDFFTNASFDKINPRWSFCLLIHYISEFFNTNYYNVLFTIKLIFSFFIPIFFYLLIYDIVKVYAKLYMLKIRIFLIFISVVLITIPIVESVFSIAWWSPLKIDPYPQNFSVFLSLFSWLTIRYGFTNKKQINNFISIFTFIISGFIHPVASFWFIIFIIFIYPFNVKEKINVFKLRIFVIIMVFILISIIFKPNVKLSSQEFINIYCLLGPHPKHYLMSFFLTPKFIDWKLCVVGVIILIIIPLFYFYYLKLTLYFKLTIKSLLVVFLVLFSQWFFIYVFPSKIISTLSPIRYVPYFYWTISIIWVLFFSLIFSKISFNFSKIFLIILKLKNYFNFKTLTPFFLILFIFISNTIIDNPRQDIYQKNNKLYDFIKSTNLNSVFISGDFYLNNNIPLIGNRSVFVGNGFPFNEDYFQEFELRDQLVFGPIQFNSKIKNDIILRAYNFNTKRPSDFKKMSKIRKLDYVIVNKINNDNLNSFKNYHAIFEDHDFAVYEVKRFK